MMPTWPDLAMALGVSAVVVTAIELTKFYLRRSASGSAGAGSIDLPTAGHARGSRLRRG